ncbi:hypothetical protein FSP39_015801 [Pinctada imbricata]|uniref:B box-type domain-containing protein n=1 Tax=Pinctada imbricata TaxID=66713 RepID=A0AA89C873_PINIB|nr:hypothetical protein FSP39_015801 [Pinctada imbricata]
MSKQDNKMAFASSKIGAQEAIIKPCDLCEEDENVNWFCKDCDQSLCDRCKRTHLRSNISKSHIVLSISEGFAMGKMNISNMCRVHDKPFQFFCRTCDRNICAKCLSTKHKKHDFIDLHDLQSEVQKQLDDVIKEKEDEVQKMTKAHDDLEQHENESENYLKEKYASIDVNVKAIQKAAAEEGEKMKQSLYERIEQHDKEVKEGKQKIQGQTKVHRNEIHTIQQKLRLQTASSCNNFVKESKSKLQSLRFLSITIPDISQLFAEGRVDRNQIRQMIGNIGKMAEVSVMEYSKRNDETTTGNVLSQGKDETTTGNVLSQLEIIRTLKLNKIEKCYMLLYVSQS